MVIHTVNYAVDYPEPPVKTVTDVVSGRYLAHTHATPVERAFMAADLFMGTRELVLPTMTQAAALARVNVTYAWHALKRRGERAAIEAGHIPLVPARTTPKKTNGGALSVPLVPEIDDALLVGIARTVGTDRMLAAACAVEAAE
jgi:hypothetical protein